MELNLTEIVTRQYTLDIPEETIAHLKEEFERDDYYDSFEECLTDFINELYDNPSLFIDNYPDYCIKVNEQDDWDISYDIEPEDLIKKFLK